MPSSFWSPRFFFMFSMLPFAAAPGRGAAPPLRQQISLNGDWETGGRVPVYSGEAAKGPKIYERMVAVPADFANRRIKLEFDSVLFAATVFVDGEEAARHIGGWSAFAVDLSNRVKPGQSFRLRVVVDDSSVLKNEEGFFVWPVGGASNKLGINGDVWLRGYGRAHIEDAFVQTSVARRELRIDCTLANTEPRRRDLILLCQAIPCRAAGGEPLAPAKTIVSEVSLAPRERKTVSLVERWDDPQLYWPDDPALYLLRSRLLDGGDTVDEETRRFGFREIEIRGTQIYWNGVRANLYGDYQSMDQDGYHNKSSDISPEGWPAQIDKIKAMNIRVLRFHHCPPANHILDAADEKGLLICNESPNYARKYLTGTDRDAYVANFKKAVAGWIVPQRNHPSVYLWNATNEMTYTTLGGFTAAQCMEMGEAIRRLDPTRPIGYDGDERVAQSAMLNRHYPEGYNKEPEGSIYSWNSQADEKKRTLPDKPTGSGEMLHTNSPDANVQTAIERNKWWLGVWLRGLRYNNWTDVRPACYWFAAMDLENPDPLWLQRGLNLRNALAPVALFDKEYDDLGIAPYVTGVTPGGALPTLEAGARIARTLILYNDEFRGEEIEAEAALIVDGETLASATRSYRLGLGEHREIRFEFQVPFRGGRELALALRARKNGEPRFEEERRFEIRGEAGGESVDNAKLYE